MASQEGKHIWDFIPVGECWCVVLLLVCFLQGPCVSHVGFGLVLGEDGKKFKTRSGDVVRLVELLDEAKTRCRDSIRTRREEVRLRTHRQTSCTKSIMVLCNAYLCVLTMFAKSPDAVSDSCVTGQHFRYP